MSEPTQPPLETRQPDEARGMNIHIKVLRWGDKWVAKAQGWGVAMKSTPDEALSVLLGRMASVVKGRYKQRAFKQAMGEETEP